MIELNMGIGTGGVSCIAWLGPGVIPLWDFCVVWALCLVVMGICVSILIDCHRERKEKENRSEDK